MVGFLTMAKGEIVASTEVPEWPRQVLVLASDPDRVAGFSTVLDFLECDVRVEVNPPSALNQEEWLFCVVSSCLGSALPDVLPAVEKALPKAPLLLVGDHSAFPRVSDTLQKRLLQCLEYPLRRAPMTEVLLQARAWLANGGQGKASSRLLRTLVGRSHGIQRVRAMIGQVAQTDANVLILGETGTGKEVVARTVHVQSARREKPFVAVNCGAIPADLLESELFGHEKGAFTGALTTRQGRFELAEGGTLFLDEIGDMPLPMQVKLLRVLQERTFERVGGVRSIASDVRIIAATHRDLEAAIETKNFRADLYYRLNVFPIEMQPMRKRREDIPLLVDELSHRLEQEGRGSVRLGGSALRALVAYDWPGNVRELANLLERLAILYPGQSIEMADLPARFRCDDAAADLSVPDDFGGVAGVTDALPLGSIDLKEYLNDLEVRIIRQALDDSGGVVAQAAKQLGLRRTTLVERMRKFAISRPEDSTES